MTDEYHNEEKVDCSSPYGIGKSFTLFPRSSATDRELLAQIVKTIHVGNKRSQTVIIRVTNGADATERELFAKFFDPSFYTPHDSEFTGSATEYMEQQCTNEVNSYQRMKTLQGTSVPRFIGRYEYTKEDGGSVGLILLEYISAPLLITAYDLQPNEFEILQIKSVEAIELIHACGVIHNDVAAHNIFWDRDKCRLIVCDFAMADTFDGSVPEIGRREFNCKERDKTFMHFAVKDRGQEVNRQERVVIE
jgi:serine/threonine protein kinase